MESKFHLSFAIKNLDETRDFYVNKLGCSIGREASDWIDINFFGHQLTAVVRPSLVVPAKFYTGKKAEAPVRHFGTILLWDDWHAMKAKFEKENTEFQIEPRKLFPGTVGEQMSMFFKDPDGYGIEFKSFENSDSVFKK